MNKTYKVWVSDEFDEKPFKDWANLEGRVTLVYGSFSEDAKDANIAITRSKTKFTKERIHEMQNLECLISATHGFEHVNVDCLNEKGIKFYNVPVQSYDVAQGVMANIFNRATRLVEADRSMKRGEWEKKEMKGFRVKGKAIGIIGYGRIGKEVAKMTSAVGMNVFVYDPYSKERNGGVNFVDDLDKLLEISDFISLHVPLNEETRHLIGRKEIKKMKKGAYLINASRGGIVDEGALLKGLKTGKLSGAALDVFDYNPPFGKNTSGKLTEREDVIATPHSIGQTQDAYDEKHEGSITCAKDFINNDNKIKCE